MKFNSTRNKFSKIQKELVTNENDIFKLTKFNYQKNTNSFLKKINVIQVDTTPTYYDLYKFLGITFSTGENPPNPPEVYKDISDGNGWWSFFYPIYGFPVPLGENPEDYSYGATPWEFQTSIVIIKRLYEFPNIPDWVINGTKVISYLFNNDGSYIQNLKYILLPGSLNIDEFSIEFSEFYRWIKLEKGYNFEYYAIYPVPQNHQIFLNTKLYVYNFKNDYYGQSKQIQFK